MGGGGGGGGRFWNTAHVTDTLILDQLVIWNVIKVLITELHKDSRQAKAPGDDAAGNWTAFTS